MQRSIIRDDNEYYLSFDNQGNNEGHLIEKRYVENRNHNQTKTYIKVHQNDIHQPMDTLFIDNKWVQDKSIDQIDHSNRKIQFRRLYQLYPTNKPNFFPNQQKLIKFKKPQKLPNCIHQLFLLPPSHFRSLFLTQNFSKNGFYKFVCNKEGRFQTEVVDDFIPIYADNLEPIWQLDYDYPWQIMLIKFWAKLCKGYKNIQNSKPFQFIEAFSNSNWKYFNLTKKGQTKEMLKKYQHNQSYRNGIFLLKTKLNQNVRQSGLIPGKVSFELLSIRKYKQGYYGVLRSVMPNKWSGQFSVLDKEKQGNIYTQNGNFSLEHNIIMSQQDLDNNFASCYVAARRNKQTYFSNYQRIQIPSNQSKAVYFEINVPSNGFLDFSLKQSNDNMVVMGQKSRIADKKTKQENQDENNNRYLRTKYLLVKDLQRSQVEQNKQEIQASKIHHPLRYQMYQIQYSQGYNKGDAHFERVERGRYILRLKSQTNKKNATYLFNYSSNTNITFQEIIPDQQQKIQILKDSISLIMDKMNSPPKNQQTNKTYRINPQQIVKRNSFDQIGYGFIAVRLSRSSQSVYLLQVNSQYIIFLCRELNKQGYKIKRMFGGQQNGNYSYVVNSGQTAIVILKKIQSYDREHKWPPHGCIVSKLRNK